MSSAYFAIWDPLLRIKFGENHEQISAAWIWHRIYRLARSRTKPLGLNSYGYLDQGCHTLMQRMIERLSGSENFRLILNAKVSQISIKNKTAESVLLKTEKHQRRCGYIYLRHPDFHKDGRFFRRLRPPGWRRSII